MHEIAPIRDLWRQRASGLAVAAALAMILDDQLTTRKRRPRHFASGRRRFLTRTRGRRRGRPLASGAGDPAGPALATVAGRQDASPPALWQGLAEIRRAADRPPLHGRRRRDGAPRRDPQPRELRDAAPARHPARHRAGDHLPSVSAGQASARAAPPETRAANAADARSA